MAERKKGIRNKDQGLKGLYFGVDNDTSLTFRVDDKGIDIKIHNFRMVRQKAR